MLAKLRSFAKSALQIYGEAGIPVVSPVVTNEIQHDVNAFTQGLDVFEGFILESTGGRRTSSVRVLDAKTGTIVRLTPVENDFGEGIAVNHQKQLAQVSLDSGCARIFSLPNLELLKTLKYSGHAWGLTQRDDKFVLSDGTSRIRILDQDFKDVAKLRLHSRAAPVWTINDIALVEDRLYANLYGRHFIFEFNWKNGSLKKIIDCSGLLLAAPRNPAAVMNGIAYNPDRDTFFVTGKYWTKIFEIRF